MKALRFAAQLALYVPLMAILAYFSTEPRFSVMAPDEALVRVSFIHATQRKEACRERSAEELAKLAPNMRLPARALAAARRTGAGRQARPAPRSATLGPAPRRQRGGL